MQIKPAHLLMQLWNIAVCDKIIIQRIMKKLLLYLCACLLVLSSCSSLKKAVTEKEYIYKTDTLIEYRNIHDSIYVADTIRQKGDTVYISKYKYVWKYQTDTVIQYKDSIVYKDNSVSEVKEVKYVPAIYKWALGILIVLIVAVICYAAIKLYLKFKI